ncbi:mucin-22-like [Macrobrachium rosenbergii]|uniref:mucin-22-like n=1 Tax=Macrobrachium rosenbergii TaxID=79674 RepID=UPI0034D5D9EF
MALFNVQKFLAAPSVPELSETNLTKSSVGKIETAGKTETEQAECLATSGDVTSISEWLSSLEAFKPYIYEGMLAAQGGSVQVPVKVLCDTGSNHSVVVRGAHPHLEKNLTGDSVILKGIGGEEAAKLITQISRQLKGTLQDNSDRVETTTISSLGTVLTSSSSTDDHDRADTATISSTSNVLTTSSIYDQDRADTAAKLITQISRQLKGTLQDNSDRVETTTISSLGTVLTSSSSTDDHDRADTATISSTSNVLTTSSIYDQDRADTQDNEPFKTIINTQAAKLITQISRQLKGTLQDNSDRVETTTISSLGTVLTSSSSTDDHDRADTATISSTSNVLTTSSIYDQDRADTATISSSRNSLLLGT